MIIKQIGIALSLIFMSTYAMAQSTVNDFVREGVRYHDSGNFDKAISSYEKALKIEPNSTLVNYEISMTYFAKGDYAKAIKHADVVLKQNKEYKLEAYVNKGSSLDQLGKTKEAIKLFDKAIKEMDGHYLLYYNLALTYYKLGEFDKAEKNCINAIGNKSSHASSHLMLASINEELGNKVPALLASHFFLLLEPNSSRSATAYAILQKNFMGNVTKDPNKPNTININLAANNDSEFAAVELMIAMLEASKSLEENQDKTEDEFFVKNTESFFKVLGELKDDKNKEIWWTFYATFDYKLAQSEYLETYCKYITQCKNENSRKWVNDNEEKINLFFDWLKND